MNHIRPVFLKLAFTACMLLWASIAVTPATAGFIQYSFTGDVDFVHKKLSSTFNTDQLMSGSMTVNDSDTNDTTGIGNYAITKFSLNIGGYTATMGTSGQVEIIDNSTGHDYVNVTVNAPNGPNVNFLAPRIFVSNLRGPASIFSSEALPTPTTSPSLSSFGVKQWRLVFGPGAGIRVSGPVTGIAAAVVPLPAAVILFGAGLVALVGLGAGSWRQKKNSLA